MAMVVVLFPVTAEAPTLHPAALERFADLGVTSVTLLQDDSTAGLVLEGWALDATRAAEAACAITSPCEGLRTLYQLAQMAVSPRRIKEEEIS